MAIEGRLQANALPPSGPWHHDCLTIKNMLAWDSSAVRVEEAFSDALEGDVGTQADQFHAVGFQKQISLNSRVQLYWRAKNGQHYVCSRAINVDEYQLVVEADRPGPVRTVVVVNTVQAGFIGRATIDHCATRGCDYLISLRM